MAGTGCYTCLGRDQGCGAGTCAIVKEVPKDTICQECAGYASRTGTPPNILCCGLPFHKKHVVKDVVEIMERWIPDFKAAALGMQVGVNWLQVNHSLVSNREAEWKDDNAGKSLVYNTQTRKTQAVNYYRPCRLYPERVCLLRNEAVEHRWAVCPRILQLRSKQ